VLSSQCLQPVIALTGVLSHEQTKQKGYPQPRDVPCCCLTTCGDLLIPVSPCQLLPLFLLCLSSRKTAVWACTGYWTYLPIMSVPLPGFRVLPPVPSVVTIETFVVLYKPICLWVEHAFIQSGPKVGIQTVNTILYRIYCIPTFGSLCILLESTAKCWVFFLTEPPSGCERILHTCNVQQWNRNYPVMKD